MVDHLLSGMMGAVPHGFDDDEPTRRLLRSPPPERARRWAGQALGGPVRATALQGGMSSAVHRVEGPARTAILRRYVRAADVSEQPDIAAMEARALRIAARAGVPTPEVIAVDEDGAEVGVPAILMTALPGHVDWDPPDRERWLRRMAETIPVVHALPLPAPGEIRPYAGYRQKSYEPPRWARRPAVWTRAVELFHEPPPSRRRAFIHRDYHPGNVLWDAGRISGIVDWESASIGPPDIDIGHFRSNLIQYGHDVVTEFTAIWEQASGLTYDPWADIGALIGSLDGLRESVSPDRFVAEELIAAAVAELG